MSSTTTDTMIKLYEVFIAKFNDEELADLAFVMGVSIKELGEDTTKGKARELAAFIVRREWVTKLAEIGPLKRPDVNWAAILEGETYQQLLSDSDRRTLVDILADSYEMQLGPAARFGLLDKAGLRERAKHIELATAPLRLAQTIVADLEPLGMLSRQPSFHALGALINYILTQPDTPQHEARILAELLVKYQLIADPAYLDDLAARHSIKVKPVRQLDPSLLPPPVSPIPTDSLLVAATKYNSFDFKVEPVRQFDPSSPPPPVSPIPTTGPLAVAATEDNFLDVELLAGAIYAAQAVGRIELPHGRALGTGFLVGPNLLLTACSVLNSKDALEAAVIRFDFTVNADGIVSQGRLFKFMPDFYVSSPPNELDFALARVRGEPLAERGLPPEDEGLNHLELLRRGRHRGYLAVSPSSIVKDERVNSIQHPNGGPLRAVLTQNYVLADMTANRVHYIAETRPGSGGSPILNRRWEVVALHHSSGAHPPLRASDSDYNSKVMAFPFKEGIPMRAILPQIERYLPRS